MCLALNLSNKENIFHFGRNKKGIILQKNPVVLRDLHVSRLMNFIYLMKKKNHKKFSIS